MKSRAQLKKHKWVSRGRRGINVQWCTQCGCIKEMDSCNNELSRSAPKNSVLCTKVPA